MSAQLVRAVLAHPFAPATLDLPARPHVHRISPGKLQAIMVKIADRARNDGTNAVCSLSYLARSTCHIDTARLARDYLLAAGYLSIERPGDPRRSTIYRVNRAALAAAPLELLENVTDLPAAVAAGGEELDGRTPAEAIADAKRALRSSPPATLPHPWPNLMPLDPPDPLGVRPVPVAGIDELAVWAEILDRPPDKRRRRR